MSGYRCHACDYDLCEECYKRNVEPSDLCSYKSSSEESRGLSLNSGEELEARLVPVYRVRIGCTELLPTPDCFTTFNEKFDRRSSCYLGSCHTCDIYHCLKFLAPIPELENINDMVSVREEQVFLTGDNTVYYYDGICTISKVFVGSLNVVSICRGDLSKMTSRNMVVRLLDGVGEVYRLIIRDTKEVKLVKLNYPSGAKKIFSNICEQCVVYDTKCFIDEKRFDVSAPVKHPTGVRLETPVVDVDDSYQLYSNGDVKQTSGEKRLVLSNINSIAESETFGHVFLSNTGLLYRSCHNKFVEINLHDLGLPQGFNPATVYSTFERKHFFVKCDNNKLFLFKGNSLIPVTTVDNYQIP